MSFSQQFVTNANLTEKLSFLQHFKKLHL